MSRGIRESKRQRARVVRKSQKTNTKNLRHTGGRTGL